MDIEQIGNGICISRKCDFKRLELLSGIKEHVTLIHGPTWRHNNPYKLNVKFMQEYHDIRPKDIVVKLNRHKVGFILSDIEGGNFATSEYMLCGLPVISTPSYGGREYFFNGTNSIICDATVGAVNKAYIAALPTEWNRTKIRNDTIKIFNEDRSRFIRLTQLIFNKNNISINAEAYFNGKLLEQKDRNKRFYRYVDIM
jgi:glycosyltransferase involved in cell wall biosynthesis